LFVVLFSGEPSTTFQFDQVPSLNTVIDSGDATQILYSPSGHPDVEAMIAEMQIFLNATTGYDRTFREIVTYLCRKTTTFIAFENGTIMENYRNNSQESVFAGIIFDLVRKI
jgi:hypothetical protein